MVLALSSLLRRQKLTVKIANATTKVAYPPEEDMLDEVDGILTCARRRKRKSEVEEQVVLITLNPRVAGFWLKFICFRHRIELAGQVVHDT